MKERFYKWSVLVKKDWKKHYPLYFMAIPTVLYFLLWGYVPLYGIIAAFEDFSPRKGIFGSEFIGFGNFISFFSGAYAWRVIRNTLLINFYNLIFGFPIPLIFALALNEIHNRLFKRTVQTITYMPYFISTVVLCGILVDFCASTGVFGQIQSFLGAQSPRNLLSEPGYFRSIYVISDIWQRMGWDSILFLSALSAVNPELYEAAQIDGAGRFKQVWHVSLPGILPTVAILLVLRIGSMMSLGFEKIILLYNGLTYETADVISSYVYRKGLVDGDFGFATAVGLFNSIINFLLVILANKTSEKLTDTSLW